MKQASIILDKEIAGAYLGAPGSQRKKLDYIINSWLKNIFSRDKDPKQQLFKTMEEMAAQAKANGLTPEILDQILLEIKQERRNEKG